MTGKPIGEDEPQARHYVAVRLLPEDFRALTLLAKADRRARGQYLEMLLIDKIREQQSALTAQVDKHLAKRERNRAAA